MPPIKTLWAQRILAARLAAGLTQVQVAAAVGVVQQNISAWETGVTIPKDENRIRLARALGVDPTELFSYPDDPDGDQAAA